MSGAGVTSGARLAEVYPAHIESVPVLRAVVAEFAGRMGAPAATVEAVKLAVSEAATNVVMHAYRQDATRGAIAVRADLVGADLCVVVADTGGGLRPRDDSPGLGLGLAIIAQLTDGLEIVHPPAGGLELRMRFGLPPAQPHRSG